MNRTSNTNAGQFKNHAGAVIELNDKPLNESRGFIENEDEFDVDSSPIFPGLFENKSGGLIVSSSDAELKITAATVETKNAGETRNNGSIDNGGTLRSPGRVCGPGPPGTRFTPRSAPRPGPTAGSPALQARCWRAWRAVLRCRSSPQHRAAKTGSRTGTPPGLRRRNRTPCG